MVLLCFSGGGGQQFLWLCCVFGTRYDSDSLLTFRNGLASISLTEK